LQIVIVPLVDVNRLGKVASLLWAMQPNNALDMKLGKRIPLPVQNRHARPEFGGISGMKKRAHPIGYALFIRVLAEIRP
jgi:hypothetical protein